MSFWQRNRGGGAGGGIGITTQKITFLGTVKEILFFTVLYSVACIVQLAIICVVALLLGKVAGLAFLAIVFLLEFSPRVLADVRPPRIGVYFQHTYYQKEKPGHVTLTQAVLFVAGILALGTVLAGYFPNVWQWRIGWDGAGYILLSRWSWDVDGQWYIATTLEVLARCVLVFAVPFVGWISTLLVKWASKMEVMRPTFREAPFVASDPAGMEGPTGEKFKSPPNNGGGGGGSPVVVVPAYD